MTMCSSTSWFCPPRQLPSRASAALASCRYVFHDLSLPIPCRRSPRSPCCCVCSSASCGVFPSCPAKHRMMSVGAASTILSTISCLVCSSPIFIAGTWFVKSWTSRSTGPLACGPCAGGFWGTDPENLFSVISRCTCTSASRRPS